jgi:hypothetical protein
MRAWFFTDQGWFGERGQSRFNCRIERRVGIGTIKKDDIDVIQPPTIWQAVVQRIPSGISEKASADPAVR